MSRTDLLETKRWRREEQWQNLQSEQRYEMLFLKAELLDLSRRYTDLVNEYDELRERLSDHGG